MGSIPAPLVIPWPGLAVENQVGHLGYKHLVGVGGACSVGLPVVRAAAAGGVTEAV